MRQIKVIGNNKTRVYKSIKAASKVLSGTGDLGANRVAKTIGRLINNGGGQYKGVWVSPAD